MKAKTIEALDGVISSLETLKEALEAEASKSGDDADDEGSGKVAGRKAKAGAAAVPAKGKGKAGSKAPVEDVDDVDDPAADDDDDVDGTGTDDDDGDEAPPAKPLKDKGGKTKPAAKTAPAKTAKAKTITEPDEFDEDAVRDLMNAIVKLSDDGMTDVRAILKKFDAQKVADLDDDAEVYEKVWRAGFKKYKALKAAAEE